MLEDQIRNIEGWIVLTGDLKPAFQDFKPHGMVRRGNFQRDAATGVNDAVRVEIAYRLKRTGTPARVGLTLVMEASHAH